MYCIITDNEKIINYAKKQGAQVVEVEKSVIIKNNQEIKYSKVTPEVVDDFLRAFPSIDMEHSGTRILKYILQKKLGYEKDLRQNVYPKIAKKFKTDISSVERSIMHTYANCITNMPIKYEKFFDRYECSVHWECKYSYEFVKACQEYLDENGDILIDEKEITTETVKKFLNGFKNLSEDTLGYRCFQYIFEKQIDCSGNIETTVYPLLIKKFNTKLKCIKQSMTYAINNCRRCMIKEYSEFFNKEMHFEEKSNIEELNCAFIRACQLYLKTQM